MELSVSARHHHTTRILLHARRLLLAAAAAPAVRGTPVSCCRRQNWQNCLFHLLNKRSNFVTIWLVLMIVIGQRHDFPRPTTAKLPLPHVGTMSPEPTRLLI